MNCTAYSRWSASPSLPLTFPLCSYFCYSGRYYNLIHLSDSASFERPCDLNYTIPPLTSLRPPLIPTCLSSHPFSPLSPHFSLPLLSLLPRQVQAARGGSADILQLSSFLRVRSTVHLSVRLLLHTVRTSVSQIVSDKITHQSL